MVQSIRSTCCIGFNLFNETEQSSLSDRLWHSGELGRKEGSADALQAYPDSSLTWAPWKLHVAN